MPEPMMTRDGTDKNDCERKAAKRFVGTLRQDHPHLKCIVPEDRLSANAPHSEMLQDHDLHSILGVKKGDHPSLFPEVEAAEQAGRVTYYARHDRAAGRVHRFRFVDDVALNASNADVRVHFLEDWAMGDEKVQHCSWVTDLRVNTRTVLHLMRGGRARWKMENATFNTLKNQGYNFAHHDGHGQQNLSVVFAMLMLWAFLVDQAQQRCCALWQAVWTKLGSKRLLWERMRALFYD
jgi:hypothetical protein